MLRVFMVMSFVTLSIVTLMTGSSLIDLSSGFSMRRLTGCERLMSSESSQVLDAPHEPEQPMVQTCWTAVLQNDGFDAEQERIRYVSPGVELSYQPPMSIVNFLSGSVRSKLVTSELINPQPPRAPTPRPMATPTAQRKLR